MKNIITVKMGENGKIYANEINSNGLKCMAGEEIRYDKPFWSSEDIELNSIDDIRKLLEKEIYLGYSDL